MLAMVAIRLRSRCRPLTSVYVLFACWALSGSVGRTADPVIDSPMYKLPDLSGPPVVRQLPPEAMALWLRALERPEADLKIKAAQSFALARRRGFKEVQAAVAPLLKELDQAELPPVAKLAVAESLIALDARSAADSLLREAKSGSHDLREMVEPALARWDHVPARSYWLERISDPAAPHRSLMLAIQCLAVVREAKAAERLRDLTMNNLSPGPLRLEAARALGTIRPDGLEADAESLAADASTRGLVTRRCAAALLRQHRSPKAIALLQRLAVDAEATVAGGAVARLLEINPQLVVPSVDKLLASADANLRAFAVTVLHRRPTEAHLRLLGDRLDDLHPDVRIQARDALIELAAKKEWRDHVLAVATQKLATRQWRALEQATIVLTRLEHKPAAKRLVELLTFERPEVTVTASWGLRKLAAAETLPDVTRHVDAAFGRFKSKTTPPSDPYWAVDHRLSQLCQLLGQQKHQPADPVLRRFIAKPMEPLIAEGRIAAIWALGLIHEGNQVPALATALEERLNDTMGIPPEDDRVRRMSVVTLGRIRAESALPTLRGYFAGHLTVNQISNACGWSIERMTGEKMPPGKPIQLVQRDWFLTPN